MNHISKSKTNKKLLIGVLFAIIILLLMWRLLGDQKTIQPSSNGQENNQNKITHGLIDYSSEIGDDLEIEFWFDNPRYRLSWSKIGKKPYIHMISPQGEKLYHNLVEQEQALISYISPKMHQWLFTDLTEEDYMSLDTRKEDDLEVKHYVIKKLWSIDGAQQDFYLEDLTKYFDDSQLKKVVVRTTSSMPQSEEDLVKSSYTFRSIEFLDDIDQSIFELVYPLD
jgi:hypothetical protein